MTVRYRHVVTASTTYLTYEPAVAPFGSIDLCASADRLLLFAPGTIGSVGADRDTEVELAVSALLPVSDLDFLPRPVKDVRRHVQPARRSLRSSRSSLTASACCSPPTHVEMSRAQ